jgi:hypothetical protein
MTAAIVEKVGEQSQKVLKEAIIKTLAPKVQVHDPVLSALVLAE